MAGRRPINPALKLLRGNPGKRDVPTGGVIAPPGRPMKPPLEGVASEHWDYLASLLEAENRLTKSDGPHLTAAAIAYALASKLTAVLMNPDTPLWFVEVRPDADGGERQEIKKHPVFAEERSQWERYRKVLNDLCLSAGTRARARTTGAKPVSKVEQFKNAKR